jgi:transposase-like protein
MSQRRKRRKFSAEFKEEAVKRMLKGESPTVLSKELSVLRKDLYEWKKAYRNGKPLENRPGPKAVKQSERGGSALKRARMRVAELERKVGRQALELDFFAKALRCLDQAATSNDDERSTSSSERKRRKAN